ncbi:hypothetical protein Sjap_005930 [Stephania japonica]|uniref:Uncharacterized protein n=1 Tax=Stephania japonica TaxID=461633 RepID=A0AAP0K7E8_9MAGN
MSLKRVSVRSGEDNCVLNRHFQRKESICMETSNNGKDAMEVVMTEPNCSSKDGKDYCSRSIIASLRSSAKHKVLAQDNLTYVRKKRKEKVEHSGGNPAGNKMSHVECATIEGPCILNRQDDVNFIGYDEEHDKLSLVQRSKDVDLSLIPFGRRLADSDSTNGVVVTRSKVRETLRLFQAMFRKFVQDSESKTKGQPNYIRRIDLKVASILKEKMKWVNTGKPILGPVPGVEVGDEFHYRVELAIVGLHHPFQAGIDCLNTGSKSLATSIVSSGGYDGEIDGSDVLIYSGQGGNPGGGETKANDQKLERGNLALKNSMDEKIPVRVIRGFKDLKESDSLDARGKTISTFTYFGLYLVERYWVERGRHGNNVFMFRLRRILGQPELALKEVKMTQKSRVRVGVCVDDISQGKEKMPISAVNTIDDEKPSPLEYITNMIYPLQYNPVPPVGCDCINGCSDSLKCSCALRNGGELPFNHDGAIVEAKPLVYECGPSCKCPPSCYNRVSQHGIKFPLEIFKTKSTGWGVRSLSSIPSGSFICEYTGELLQDREAEQRTGNDEYLFDIGHNYNDAALWDGLSTLMPSDLKTNSACETVEGIGFTIDAAKFGNIGRFINHSCSPNLYAQNVLFDHGDKRMPHIMLFCAENIPPLQELTYHYNYSLDQVRDSDGNIKRKACYCGSSECSGRMY